MSPQGSPFGSHRAAADFRHDPEYIRQRRATIRRHHPDAGGTDAELIKALDNLDEQWSRRHYLRSQLEQSRPAFIPEDVAQQAFDTAEEWADAIQRRASALRSRGEALVDKSPLPKDLPRSAAQAANRVAGAAGRVAGTASSAAGSVRRRVRERFTKDDKS